MNISEVEDAAAGNALKRHKTGAPERVDMNARQKLWIQSTIDSVKRSIDLETMNELGELRTDGIEIKNKLLEELIAGLQKEIDSDD